MEKDCIFCSFPPDKIIVKNELALAFFDKYPVNRGHTLLVPKRHFAYISDATSREILALHELALEVQRYLTKEFRPDGFNFGINQGEVAGQTIFHLHIHIIPRYLGDVKNPRGGIRNFKDNLIRY